MFEGSSFLSVVLGDSRDIEIDFPIVVTVELDVLEVFERLLLKALSLLRACTKINYYLMLF